MFTLTVYRRLDNRQEGLSDDSPRAVELHRLRADALHDLFDGDQTWRVRSWGGTYDEKPHEVVELLLLPILEEVAVQIIPLAVPALEYLGKVLLEAGIKVAMTEAVKYLVFKSRNKQKERQFCDLNLIFPDHVTKISLLPDPGTLTITLCKQTSLKCDATSAEGLEVESMTHNPMEVTHAWTPAIRELIDKAQAIPDTDQDNRKHIRYLRQGRQGRALWEEWRNNNSKTIPDLSKEELSYANLDGFKLNRTNLSKANLSFASLRTVNLRDANLSSANLRYAVSGGKPDLSNANLNGADLSNADFHSAILRNADLSRANLEGANLNGVTLYNANLCRANLCGADLGDAGLDGADLNEANLKDAKFLRPEKIKLAKNWETAIYDEDFRDKLS